MPIIVSARCNSCCSESVILQYLIIVMDDTTNCDRWTINVIIEETASAAAAQ